jgi:ABC-2 type transport system permease protein
MPLRAIISLPWTLALLYAVGGGAGHKLARDPATIAVLLASIVLALVISFSVSAFVGTLALYFESAMSLWELFMLSFMMASGYIIPLPLFPAWAQHALAFTPFPYMLAVPVEILIGMRRGADALHALGAQATCAAIVVTLLLLEWRGALKRYGAFGG